MASTSDGALPAHLHERGLHGRPLTFEDVTLVHRVIAREEAHDAGRTTIELADLIADWQRPSFDVPGSTFGVFAGPALVGYAEVTSDERGDAAVDPEFRGQGIGTFLAAWMRDTARRRGCVTIRMPVREGSPADRLLTALGYHHAATSWVLHLPPDTLIPERSLPEGHEIRTATSDEDRAVWTLLEDAFLEWADREREEFSDFMAQTRLRPDFEPWNLRVVTSSDGEIVAAAIVLLSHPTDDQPVEAYVDRIGVRARHRGLGLAQALLADCFRVARDHGAVRSSLSTDSRTGALSLYEKVGMQVSEVWVNRAIHLGPGSQPGLSAEVRDRVQGGGP